MYGEGDGSYEGEGKRVEKNQLLKKKREVTVTSMVTDPSRMIYSSRKTAEGLVWKITEK